MGNYCCPRSLLSSSSSSPSTPVQPPPLSSSTPSAPDQPPPTSLPEQLQELPLSEITLDGLEEIIPLIEQEVHRLRTSASHAPISQTLSNKLGQRKEICTSFIRSIPKQLNTQVAETSKSLFMPLLTNVLRGVGGLHWLGVGFLFIAWSLDNINTDAKNREECIEILRRSLHLLKNTYQIWHAINIDNAKKIEDLQDSVEKAARCAIFCTSNLTEAWILSILKAPTIKFAIATFADELDRANSQNMEFMLRYNLQSSFEQQFTFHLSDDRVAGHDKAIQDAITFLETSSDDMKVVCLHGMGGIGKSFLGLKIFTQFQKGKYRDCRVELRLKTKQGELCDIQKQIIEKVCKHATPKFSDPLTGRQIMETELKKINDPIFLYVDNVLDHQYLPTLLPKASFFPKESRILITSRGEYIKQGIVGLGITHSHFELIEVRKLQKQQARQLLWDQLVNSNGEHTEISEVKALEERVLELCDGLPLALIVVGKYINANENGPKNVEVWHEVVDAMQKAEALDGVENDELYSRVKFSIQNLDQNVKQAFLEMIFFVDQTWSVPTWESIERLVSHRHLKVLFQRALVRKKERSFQSPSSAEIHDVLKAMGKRLLENERLELCIRGMDKLEKHKNALEKVVALYGVTVDACLLKQMPLLRLLQNVKVDSQEECQEIQLRHLRVVRGASWSTFRVFDWSECASLKELELVHFFADDPEATINLEVLKHDKISMALEALTLRGRRESQLRYLDVIEAFTCLKELRLISCQKIEFLPEGISRLMGLKQLQLRSCEKLKCLPQGISRLMRLEVLDLDSCESLQSLPDGLMSLTGLTELHLDRCASLQSIPEGIGNLRAVTHFTLSGCESLESIPEGATSLMSGLTELSLGQCTRIKYLPGRITRLTGLTKLDLHWCKSIRSLPGVSGLTGLTSLSLCGCQRLQALPEGIASLSSLIELDLRWCSALRALPKELPCGSGLTTLRLNECRNLQFLPNDMSKLTGLVHLHLYGCKSLRSIEGVTKLAALRILDVRNCTELQLLPEGCTRLTSLRHIYLSGCRSLKSIPEARLGHLMTRLLHRLPEISIQEQVEEQEEEES